MAPRPLLDTIAALITARCSPAGGADVLRRDVAAAAATTPSRGRCSSSLRKQATTRNFIAPPLLALTSPPVPVGQFRSRTVAIFYVQTSLVKVHDLHPGDDPGQHRDRELPKSSGAAKRCSSSSSTTPASSAPTTTCKPMRSSHQSLVAVPCHCQHCSARQDLRTSAKRTRLNVYS